MKYKRKIILAKIQFINREIQTKNYYTCPETSTDNFPISYFKTYCACNIFKFVYTYEIYINWILYHKIL